MMIPDVGCKLNSSSVVREISFSIIFFADLDSQQVASEVVAMTDHMATKRMTFLNCIV